MEDQSHSHKLGANAIKIVVNAFADAPYRSPTGSTGINLHIDQGPDSTLNFTTNTTWGDLSKAGPIAHVDALGTGTTSKYEWADFQNIKADRFIPTGRLPIFHYVVAAHQYGSTDASGISRGVSSNDFIISLGAYTNSVGSVAEQAGTLMHELGHNLGLRHGGGDDINYKPNHLSVMNYSYQLRGLMFDGQEGVFDYSRRSLATLNERSLPAESVGLGAEAAPYGARRFCAGFGRLAVLAANGPIDWNCDGKVTGVGLFGDVNGDGARSQLQGFDDWANITLVGGAIGRVEPGSALQAQATSSVVVPDDDVTLAVETEADLLTTEVADEIQPEPVGDEDILIIPPLRARRIAPTSARLERTSRPSAAIPIGPLAPVTRTLTNIAQSEGLITVLVGVPGVRNVSLAVHGTRFSLPLTSGEDEKEIDVSSALRPGEENEIVVTAVGRPGSSVYVIVWDGDTDFVLDPDLEEEELRAGR